MDSTSEQPGDGQTVMAGYANYFEVGHNAFEFLIDFGQIDPYSGKFNIASRTAISPTHAKLLSGLLSSAVRQYEEQYEPIPEIRNDDLLESALDPSPFWARILATPRQSGPRRGGVEMDLQLVGNGTKHEDTALVDVHFDGKNESVQGLAVPAVAVPRAVLDLKAGLFPGKEDRHAEHRVHGVLW